MEISVGLWWLLGFSGRAVNGDGCGLTPPDRRRLMRSELRV